MTYACGRHARVVQLGEARSEASRAVTSMAFSLQVSSTDVMHLDIAMMIAESAANPST